MNSMSLPTRVLAVLALALAFGLGGQKWAAHMLERWWPREERRDE